jgi:TetR/AcrR family transcriptional repressor of nem operon
MRLRQGLDSEQRRPCGITSENELDLAQVNTGLGFLNWQTQSPDSGQEDIHHGFHSVSTYGMMIIMRFPKEHKARVRERIVRAAARKLRGAGLEGASVPDLMQEAGLTHGGFYGYFRSRDELVAEAVRNAATETAEGLFKASPDLPAVLDAYLSEDHLRRPDSGCVVAALGSDGRRKGKRVRAAFADVAEGLARLVDEKLGSVAQGDAISDRALAVTAQMVGAVVLGRLVDDPVLAGRIVSAAREAALKI